MTLHVEGLTVTLPGAGKVLDDVDLHVGPGERLAIVGESGAGKSVLARTLLGLTQDDPRARVTADRFEIDGRDVRRLSRRAWRRMRGTAVSLVLQDALQSLDPLRTVEAEVGAPAEGSTSEALEQVLRDLAGHRLVELDDAPVG